MSQSSTTIDIQTTVVQNKDIVHNAVDEDMVLMSIAQGKYYGMAPISRQIWELLAEPCQIVQVCDELLKEYKVDRDTCQRDVLAFIQQLVAEQLVEIIAAPGEESA